MIKYTIQELYWRQKAFRSSQLKIYSFSLKSDPLRITLYIQGLPLNRIPTLTKCEKRNAKITDNLFYQYQYINKYKKF